MIARSGGGQHENWNVTTGGTEPLGNLKPVDIGKHDVEDDRVKPVLHKLRKFETTLAIEGDLGRPALELKVEAQPLGKNRFVFD